MFPAVAPLSQASWTQSNAVEQPHSVQAIEILREDFSEYESVGPKRVAEFLGDSGNETMLADAHSSRNGKNRTLRISKLERTVCGA